MSPPSYAKNDRRSINRRHYRGVSIPANRNGLHLPWSDTSTQCGRRRWQFYTAADWICTYGISGYFVSVELFSAINLKNRLAARVFKNQNCRANLSPSWWIASVISIGGEDSPAANNRPCLSIYCPIFIPGYCSFRLYNVRVDREKTPRPLYCKQVCIFANSLLYPIHIHTHTYRGIPHSNVNVACFKRLINLCIRKSRASSSYTEKTGNLVCLRVK